MLLGLIIEKLTGMSASDALRKRREPLGLKQTSLPLPDEWVCPTPTRRATSSSPMPRPSALLGAQGQAGGGTGREFQTAQLHGRQPVLGVDRRRRDFDRWRIGDHVKALVGGGLLNAKMQKIRTIPSDQSPPARAMASGWRSSDR